MPLVPRYTWEEDASNLGLELQLPGIALRHIDIYVSDLVIKINAAPYVLLLDLFDAVDDASTMVKSLSASNVLRIAVKKVHPRVWHELQFQGIKRVARERREASMERKRVSERALSEKRKEKRHLEEKETLRAQMAVDDTNRQILTELKADEKDREERSLYESLQHLHVQKETQMENTELQQRRDQSKVCEPFNRDLAMPKSSPNGSKSASNRVEREGRRVSSSDDVIELTSDGSFDLSHTQQHLESGNPELSTSSNDAKAQRLHLPNAIQMSASKETPDALDVPPPRQCVHSHLCFTPRVFPTPSRESKAMEEENWLLKNRKYLHHHANLARSANDDISETDPMWLKAKGDDFFHAKDFASALQAYTDAISAVVRDDTGFMATCLSNRAACWLATGKFEECVTDCSTALSYLPDTRELIDQSRAIPSHRLKLKLFVRRGTAACRLGRYGHAKADYSVACTLAPQNPQLHEDFLTLVAMATAQELKEQGDELVKTGHDVAMAIEVYSKALALHPGNVACLANRAACYLMVQCAVECTQDCTRALELLQKDVGQAHQVVEFAAYPASGSLARREWVVKTLVRRGTAFVWLRKWDQAEQDFAASVELDPSNEALQADLANVRNERKQAEVKCDMPPLRV